MRRWRLPVILAISLLGALGARGEAFESAAPFALLIDDTAGVTLYAKNADQPMAPASTAKLMTAEIVFGRIKAGKLSLDDLFTVSQNAWLTGGAKAHGSTMFLNLKSQVRVEDLLRGMIIQSGNDAAIVLAEGIAGTEDNFALLMNARAEELGMMHSHFTSPWGKPDPAQVVTAYDMAKLASHLIHDDAEFYHYFAEREFTWDKIRQLNRNPLLLANIGADGLKTGDTQASGFGLVGSTVQDGRRLIAVINGSKTASERAEAARALIAYGQGGFETASLYKAGDAVGQADVFGGAVGSVALVAEAPIAMETPKGSNEPVKAAIVYQGPLIAPVAQDASVARLKIWRGPLLVVDAPLKTKEAVAVGDLKQRALGATLQVAGDLLRKALPKWR